MHDVTIYARLQRISSCMWARIARTAGTILELTRGREVSAAMRVLGHLLPRQTNRRSVRASFGSYDPMTLKSHFPIRI
jgi:hypothetical protein